MPLYPNVVILPFSPETRVMCYTVTINCVTECVVDEEEEEEEEDEDNIRTEIMETPSRRRTLLRGSKETTTQFRNGIVIIISLQ